MRVVRVGRYEVGEELATAAFENYVSASPGAAAYPAV